MLRTLVKDPNQRLTARELAEELSQVAEKYLDPEEGTSSPLQPRVYNINEVETSFIPKEPDTQPIQNEDNLSETVQKVDDAGISN